ncbi:MAG TPA: tetratricopeptide repeat protein [Pyrinomonadaceae bacterium]|nr:tetratricopeptide repeat protein [Pyrinomonadaceae bacterium]
MKTAKELFQRIADPALGRDERAALRCRLAKHLEERGNYKGAQEVFGELWPGVNARPSVKGLGRRAAAEVLLRAGALTGWIGSVAQTAGAQEEAKNLITEGMTVFEELRDDEKVAESRVELAVCYWRTGALDEARVMLRDALDLLAGDDGDVKALALLRGAAVEKAANRLKDALRLLTEAAPLFGRSENHTLKGRFHNELAQVLHGLAVDERRGDYVDRALIEYAAASYHFGEAEHRRYRACVENNLAFLFLTLGRHGEAHEHLDRAQALLTSLKDRAHLAQVDETRARVLLAEGRPAEAEKLARAAVATLERGEERTLLAEVMTTHGVALARLGKHERARLALRSASEIARHAGDEEGAGRAALAAVEELGDHLPNEELSATFDEAAGLLAASQDVAAHRRLAACARRVLFLTQASPVPPDWRDFSFRETMRRHEAAIIERALRDARGSVTRAARLLGFRHHHSLASIINHRHRDLLSERRPVVPRRRSLIAEHEEGLSGREEFDVED